MPRPAPNPPWGSIKRTTNAKLATIEPSKRLTAIHYWIGYLFQAAAEIEAGVSEIKHKAT